MQIKVVPRVFSSFRIENPYFFTGGYYMANVFDVLKERGYIDQVTHEEDLRELLENESVA